MDEERIKQILATPLTSLTAEELLSAAGTLDESSKGNSGHFSVHIAPESVEAIAEAVVAKLRALGAANQT